MHIDTRSEKLLAHKDGAAGWITFNNPAKRNAMSYEMWLALDIALNEFLADDAIRVIVLKGTGDKAFVSGADISEFKEKRANPQMVAEFNKVSGAVANKLAHCTKPTIAMIRGFCMGGGLGTALTCDLRICSDDARFGIPAGKLGVGYKYSALKRLTDIVGPSYAAEIFYTARQFDAQEAKDMGLVNRVLPADKLEEYVANYVKTIGQNAPLTLKAVKVCLTEIVKDETQRDLALCERVVDDCFASKDYTEGRTAFMEKRKPVFVGA
ncbi:MAG: enoyl-CoA hydratase [Betaproteobacteria bacterium]|nr:enoyl-CoA hydratase [Betaproteobacteria bacterium]